MGEIPSLQDLRILVVEDLESDFLLVKRHLAAHGVDAEYLRVARYAELDAALLAGGWDIALSDYNVPGLPFRDGLELLRARSPDLPVILVSGSVGEEEAIELLKTGLSDFVLKDRLLRLIPAIERSLREAADQRRRRATEQDLRDSEERHRLALDAAQLGTWWHDTARDLLEFDARCREHFDLDAATASLAGSMARVHADDRARVMRFVASVLDRSLDDWRPSIELRIVRRDGSVRWVAVAVRTRHDAADAPARASIIIGTSQDITDRREAEAALRDRVDLQDQMAQVAETVPGVVYSFRLRPDGTMSVPFASPAMRDVFRIARADLVDDAGPLFARVHPADRGWMTESIVASAQALTPWRGDFRLVHEDGEERWIEAHSMPHREADGSVLWHGFAQDVTERKHADERLRASESRWQFALEGSDQAVWDWNVVTGAVYFSRRWKSMLQLADHQLDNRFENWSTRVHPDDLPSALEALQRHFRGDTASYESEHRMLCAGGSERWVLDRGKVVEWSATGEPQRVIGTMTDITSRKMMEAALRESEARANLIIETVPEAILVVDSSATVVRANQRAYEVFRYPPGTLEGSSADDLVPAALRDRHLAMRTQFLADGRQSAMGMGRELSAVRADGEEFPAEISLGIVQLGGERNAIVTVNDISSRKRAEQALRRSEHTLAQAQTMANLGSWQADFASDQLVASEALQRLLRLEGAVLPTAAVFAMVHPDDLDAVRDAWVRALKGQAPYDHEYRTIVDGTVRWLHVKAIMERNPDGRAVSAVGMSQDITEVREAQLTLEAHRQHLETLVAARTAEVRQQASYLYALVDNMPFQVWLKDTESRYLAVNRANASAFGLAESTMVGRTDAELLPTDRARTLVAEDEEVRRAKRPRGGEERVDRDGQLRWVETYNAPVLDQNGDVIGTVGFARDITDRKVHEAARDAALAEARRLAQVRSDFLANMSHEIRTPLNAVLGLAQAGVRTGSDEAVHRMFRRILDSGALLLGVVDDILDFSKIEAGKFSLQHMPFSPSDVVDRALSLLAPRAYAKGLTMRVRETPHLPTALLGDAQRLSQVLVNLLANAVKFTEHGEVALSMAYESGRLAFVVEDTGIGIPEAYLGRLFQPFEQADGSTTRRFGGTGLGLAITRRLLEMMDGEIRVASVEGRGTRFDLSVPLAAIDSDSDGGPLPSRVALVGLAATEAGLLAEQLGALGIEVTTGEALAPADHPADLTVLDSAVYESLAAPPASGRVVVACLPGWALTGVPDDGRVSVAERPLRVRHLLAAGTESRPDDAGVGDGAGGRLQGMRLLAAEDNEVNRLVLETLLGQEGAQLVQTENGRLAVERLAADGPEAFDAILTDIQMPEMDGYETARRVKALAPDIPVIGLTAHAMPEERERCLAAGMVEHVAKPVDVDRLVAILRAHVPRFATAGTPRAGASAQGRAFAVRMPDPESAPLVDWSALLIRFKGRREFVDKLVVTVIRTHENTAERLRVAVADGDTGEIAFVAHSLKGMGGNLMALPLRTLADRTEAAARLAAPDTRGLAARLAEVLDDTLAALAEGLP